MLQYLQLTLNITVIASIIMFVIIYNAKSVHFTIGDDNDCRSQIMCYRVATTNYQVLQTRVVFWIMAELTISLNAWYFLIYSSALVQTQQNQSSAAFRWDNLMCRGFFSHIKLVF